jgi:hypothetical protein
MAELMIGAKVKIDGTHYEVARVGKEIKLVAKTGETIWRHSRTVARLLEEQAPKPRRRRGDEKSPDETGAENETAGVGAAA